MYPAKLAKILRYYGASHINDQDDDGNRFGDTPLMKAANQGKIKYCKLLVSAGANVNAQSTGKLNSFKKGATALYWATYQNRPEIVTLLLQNNALVDLANWHNTTPLIVAARHGSIECAKLLIAAGANVNAQKKHGNNVLYYAQRNNNPQLIQLLLDAGAQPRKCTLL